MWFLWSSSALRRLSEQLEEQKRLLKRLRFEQLELVARMSAIEKLLGERVRRKPGPIGFEITDERKDDMADVIRFAVNLPPKAAPDVVSRELTVMINDNDPVVKSLDAEVLVVDGLEGPQDAAVQVILVDIDDSGNRSEASSITFTLVDLIPPPKPGELGVVVLDEKYGDTP